MSVNERIKEVRRTLGLSQAKFAAGISISNGYIAGIELGKRRANDRIIKLICAQYQVSEAWLKEGVGEMFTTAPDARLEHIIRAFEGLRPEFQDYVLEQIDRLKALQVKRDGD